MKLLFKIDKKYDEDMIVEFLTPAIAGDLNRFADLMRIDPEDIMSSKIGKIINCKKLIPDLVDTKYLKIKSFLKNSVVLYQESWNKINADFFQLVEKKTGYPWKHKKYYCVVSAYHEGISSWGGNTVARRWSINSDTQRRITAHELTLSHFWTILESNTISKKWNQEKKWQYSEILSWCLLGLDPDFYKFWPWELKKNLFPENHQYRDIIVLQRKSKNLYLTCSNFQEFIQKIITSNTSQ